MCANDSLIRARKPSARKESYAVWLLTVAREQSHKSARIPIRPIDAWWLIDARWLNEKRKGEKKTDRSSFCAEFFIGHSRNPLSILLKFVQRLVRRIRVNFYGPFGPSQLFIDIFVPRSTVKHDFPIGYRLIVRFIYPSKNSAKGRETSSMVPTLISFRVDLITGGGVIGMPTDVPLPTHKRHPHVVCFTLSPTSHRSGILSSPDRCIFIDGLIYIYISMCRSLGQRDGSGHSSTP